MSEREEQTSPNSSSDLPRDPHPNRAHSEGADPFDLLLKQLEDTKPLDGGDAGGASGIFASPVPGLCPAPPKSQAFAPAPPPRPSVESDLRGTAPADAALRINVEPVPAQPEPSQASPGDFTRVFTKLPPRPTPSPAPFTSPQPQDVPAAHVESPHVVPVQAQAEAPGEFTQFFQALQPTGSGATQPQASTVEPRDPNSAAPATPPGFPANPAPELRPLAFGSPHSGEPQPQAGAFTAFFESGSLAAGSSGDSAPGVRGISPLTEKEFPVAYSSPPSARPVSGGATQLLQALEGNVFSADQPNAFSHGPTPESSGAFAPAAAFTPDSTDPPFLQAESGARPTASAATAGGFTSMLQSLHGQSSTPSPALPAQPRSAGSTDGPSEFTRVMRGSAARSGAEAPAAFTPQTGSAPSTSSGGFHIGAAPTVPKVDAAGLAKKATGTRLQRMMPWILAANGILLLVLVALVLLFLHHRH